MYSHFKQNKGFNGKGKAMMRFVFLLAMAVVFISAGEYAQAGCYKAIGAGTGVTLAVKEDGTVCAWGNDYFYQLGDGDSRAGSSRPVQTQISDVIAVSGHYYQSVALKNDGTVWSWGACCFGDEITGGTRSIPVQTGAKVADFSNITAIDAGGGLTVALKEDGTVWKWGTTPIKVSEIYDVSAIVTGNFHVVVLKKDGTVWAWGINQFGNMYGQLGNGTKTNSTTPVQVLGISNIIAIASFHHHTIALEENGTLWAWGFNKYGQLGDGTNIDRTKPVKVTGISDVIAIAAGGEVTANAGSHSIALKKDGTVWTWGSNKYGQLGDATTTDKWTPVQVSGISDVESITAGALHTVALKKDGTVWTWGCNTSGQLGDGTGTNRLTPVQTLEEGKVTVYITPKEAVQAVTDVAMWRVSDAMGGVSDWKKSGETATLPIGDYTVEFKEIPGWIKPDNQTKTASCCATEKLTGTYIKGCSIISLTGDLNFGNVCVGSTSEKILKICNTGTGTCNLTVSSVTYPDGFTGSWNNGTIPAGGCQDVTVTFKPVNPQTYTGTITVNSDKTAGTNTISVSGTGQNGFLIVNIAPATAQWKLTDETANDWHNSDYKAELKPGIYTVEFKDINCWIKPDNQTVTLSCETKTLNASYTAQPEDLTCFVTRTFSSCIPGAKLTVTLKAKPPCGISNYAVEDIPPLEWLDSVINMTVDGIPRGKS